MDTGRWYLGYPKINSSSDWKSDSIVFGSISFKETRWALDLANYLLLI